MAITKSFETATGRKVEVKGQLSASGKIEIDVIVEGFGSQGGTPSLQKFNNNGVEYAAVVGKLPLTQDQLNIVHEVRRELMQEKDIVFADQKQYGTYDEVVINNPWMRGTY